MKHVLTDIPGIGESSAELLMEYGIDSVKALRKAGIRKLCRVPGFGEVRGTVVLAAVDDLKAADKAAKQAGKDRRKAAKVAENEAGKQARQWARVAKKAEKTHSADKPKKGKKKK